MEYTRDYYHKEYDELEKGSGILHRILDNYPDLYEAYRTAKRKTEAENLVLTHLKALCSVKCSGCTRGKL